jgi:hypothetical protein
MNVVSPQSLQNAAQRQIECLAAFATVLLTTTRLLVRAPATGTMVAQIESSLGPLHEGPSLLKQSLDLVCSRRCTGELDCVPGLNDLAQSFPLHLVESRRSREIAQKLDTCPANSPYSEMVFDKYP